MNTIHHKRYETEAHRLLDKLADDMAGVAKRVNSLLSHDPFAAAHAQELTSGAEIVRQWASRIIMTRDTRRIPPFAIGQRVRVSWSGEIGRVAYQIDQPDGQWVMIVDFRHGPATMRRHFGESELEEIHDPGEAQ